MPSRVIRGEINESESLARVSLQADLTFRALLVAVDDYGRLDARPRFLRSRLFPFRDDVSADDVARWIQELAAGEDPPLRIYEVDGKPYLWLTGWEKHRGKANRAKRSKYPEPPGPAGGRRGDSTAHEETRDPQGPQGLRGDPRRSAEPPGDPTVESWDEESWDESRGVVDRQGAKANHRDRIVSPTASRASPRGDPEHHNAGAGASCLQHLAFEGDGELAARVEEIRSRLRDRSTDDRNLRAIAARMPWGEIEGAIFDAWGRYRDGLVRNPAAYFVASMRARATELGIELGLGRAGPRRVRPGTSPARSVARG